MIEHKPLSMQKCTMDPIDNQIIMGEETHKIGHEDLQTKNAHPQKILSR